MSRSRREEGYETRSHGDLGFVGERARSVDTYARNREGGSVDAMLTSDCVPSNIETIRYSMENHREMGMDRSDMPKGREPKQSGPVFGDVHSRDHSGAERATYKKGGHVMRHERHERNERREEGMKHHRRHKMAAGGVGKIRKDQY